MINRPNLLTLNELIGSDLYHQQYRLNKHIGKTLTSLRLYRQFHAFNQTKRAHSSLLYFSDTVTQMTGHTTSESSHTVYLSHYVYYRNSSAYFSAVKATPSPTLQTSFEELAAYEKQPQCNNAAF